ncbi:hypothetical protein [Luteibacter sp. E-22]|uniref:hypothetical protein n=1 Tax=Luteibacter sp. E-22 TaxID=3404050 RepID=UPI003CF5D609
MWRSFVASSQSFALSLHAFAKKAPENARQVVRKVAIDLLTATVLRTPVGNPDLWKRKPPAGYVGGRLRANWTVALVAPDTTTSEAIDKTGSTTIAKGSQTILQSDGEDDIYIMNSLPYAIPVEYGHSGVQAPQGMVRVSVAEFQAYVDKAAASLDR